ncbi:crotonase/enoyl-CoA hydratase family protein [Naumannella halotolerans]|uniref:Enoyl-CoA hydratase/carnithine racemase n=1 Tax=Naumannella halotolerans TaxID=993414 RepID=A0A4R7J1E1_9ACTN|nr:crotonase/enoyl-CoA hydratase family protein [Naumannella halotolerans]TDT30920.1 enoyl-CoA hydratase/carnithine racemase [Naumannella halotolerans]
MSNVATDLVTCEIADGIAEVRLNRPDRHNGMNAEVFRALIRIGHDLARDKQVRGVLLTGNGPSFCAGLDFKGVSFAPKDLLPQFIPNPLRGTNMFQEACWVWRRIPAPVAAAVHGNCFGAGIQLALGADFRFATTDSKWSVMEAKWGLVPDCSGVRGLAQLVGVDVAKRLVMTGEIIDGATASEWGLATETADDPVAAARELLALIASRSPDAVARGKRLLERAWPGSDRLTFVVERVAQLPLLWGENFAIARKAGMKKEQPVFRPRR